MIFTRILVALLTIGLPYRQYKFSYSFVVTAFIGSPKRFSRAPTLFGRSEQESEHLSHDLLLDESILLYSQISRQIGVENNTDIKTLRKNELTSLITDIVFDERGSVDLEKRKKSVQKDEDDRELETLDEISSALDQQILLGYQSTFTEEELAQWVGGIDALYEKLQSQVRALPPASSGTEKSVPKAVATTLTPLDQLQSRLESMRILIDPTGNARWRPPLAQSAVQTVPSITPAHTKPDTKKEDEITAEEFIDETLSKTSQPDPVEGKLKDINNPIETPNTQNPTANNNSTIQSRPGGEKWIEVPADADYIKANTFARDNDDGTSAGFANVTVGVDDPSDDHTAPDHSETPERSTRTVDVVSTVVTTAALGAAAVTKLPLFAAGVAFGPVIRDSISYAKGRMANSTKTTNPENDTNSTSVEKDKGESDSVED